MPPSVSPCAVVQRIANFVVGDRLAVIRMGGLKGAHAGGEFTTYVRLYYLKEVAHIGRILQ